MCGRYTITATPEELMKRFRVKSVEGDYHPLYNAAPTLNLPVITNHHPEKIVQYRWGLIPYFAKNPNEGFKMINARVETLAAKPAFKDSLKRRRCLVLADSFYEWKKENNRKIPYRIMLKSGQCFAFAGLWERWVNEENEVIRTFTIITTDPNELAAKFHDRMPCILRKEVEQLWLDTSLQEQEVFKLLDPLPPEEMKAYEVSTLVNSVRNESPELIKPL